MNNDGFDDTIGDEFDDPFHDLPGADDPFYDLPGAHGPVSPGPEPLNHDQTFDELTGAEAQVGIPSFQHGQFTFEGEIERFGAFSRGAATATGWKRAVVVGMVLLFTVPLLAGLVGTVVNAVRHDNSSPSSRTVILPDGRRVSIDDLITPPTVTTPPFPTESTVLAPAVHYDATIVTNVGTIVIALDTTHAPIAANHFATLANGKFYDQLSFHRVATNFVIQGGDPSGDGSGGAGTALLGEVPTDGYPVGVLAAAKAGTDPPGWFDSQFFIVTGSNASTLPNDYARFGRITAGLDVAQRIEHLAPAGSTSYDGPPTEPAIITAIRVAPSVV